MQKAKKGRECNGAGIATNEEARRDRLDWEKKCENWRMQKETKRAEQECLLIMTAMGQMMGAFAQYMGPGASSLLYPMPPYPPYPAGYYQPFDLTFPLPQAPTGTPQVPTKSPPQVPAGAPQVSAGAPPQAPGVSPQARPS